MNHIPNDTAVAPASRPAAGELHQTIFEQASDCLFVADTTGRCIEVNRAGCALLGAAREELLGRLTDDILCNAGCPPDVLDAIPRQAGQFHLAERDLARRDGGVLAAEIKLQRLADGALLASVRDLSARKQTEATLHATEAAIRKLIEASPVAMVVSSGAHEENVLVNHKFTELFGYTIADVPNVSSWWPLAYPDPAEREAQRNRWTTQVEQAVSSRGEIAPMEATVTCKDGSLRYVEFRFSSIGRHNLVTFADLTERKRMEEALRQPRCSNKFCKPASAPQR